MKFDIKIIVDSFNKLNDQTRYSIFAGVVILILALDLSLLVMPQTVGIGNVFDKINTLSSDTQEVITDKQRISQLRKNDQDLRLQLKALNNRVRNIQDVPIILGMISSIANDNNVKIDQLLPEKPVQIAIKGIKNSQYYAVPIMIKARCGYHMFGRFMNKLENDDFYFIVNDMIIQNGDKDTNVHLFSMTINLILMDRGR